MILLCGYGGDGRRVEEVEVKKQILKICKGKTVAIITNAKPKNNIQTDVEVGKFLTENQIKNKLFDLDETDISWKNYDVIYFGGGSPSMLMQAIVRNCFVNFDWKSKDIIGQSAGAMILFDKFCDELSLGANANPKLNDFKIFDGLGVVNEKRVFTPHYNTLQNSDYGRTYLKFLEENKIETLFMYDKEFILYK